MSFKTLFTICLFIYVNFNFIYLFIFNLERRERERNTTWHCAVSEAVSSMQKAWEEDTFPSIGVKDTKKGMLNPPHSSQSKSFQPLYFIYAFNYFCLIEILISV